MKPIDMDIEVMLRASDKASGQEIGGWKLDENEYNIPMDYYTGKNKNGIATKNRDGTFAGFTYVVDDYYPRFLEYYLRDEKETENEKIAGLDKESAIKETEAFLNSVGIEMDSFQLNVCLAVDKRYIEENYQQDDGEKLDITEEDEAYYMTFSPMMPNGVSVSGIRVDKGDSDAGSRPPTDEAGETVAVDAITGEVRSS